MPKQKEFIALIQEHEGIILKVIHLYAKDTADREDLKQEIIYQLWRSIDSFSGEAKITTWIYRVALNTALIQLKRRKRKIKSIPIEDAVFNQKEGSNTEEEEQIQQLYATIQQLKAVDRAIILLYLEGSSHEEIGAILGFSTSNIGTRIGRIKKQLKKLFNQTYHGA